MILSMKPKSMVVIKNEAAASTRGSVLVNNLNGVQQRSVIANGNDLLRCKRKGGFLPGQTYPGNQPASVARRNARERNRVKQVNNGFATLRSHIPPDVAAALCTEKPSARSSAASKKLSKVETLKMAVEYIRSLQELLDEHNGTTEKKSDVYEVDERYYSSSPETIVSGENSYYPNSPTDYSKSESIDSEYYPTTRNCVKSEPIYCKSDQLDQEFYSSPRPYGKTESYQHYNPEVHEALTSEFYHARSPVKAYSSPEREPPEEVLTPMTNVQPRNAFLQPRTQHRHSISLSPPMSDACPSPTPSYSSDHSSLHPGSVVSSSSGHLTSQMSQLTTAPPAQPVESQRASPESYESYEAMSPEDEELLDVISWWQQTN